MYAAPARSQRGGGMNTQQKKPNAAQGCARGGCGLAVLVVVIVIIVAVVAGGKSKSHSSAASEAGSYIKAKGARIDIINATVSDVLVQLGKVIKNGGSSTTEVDEMATEAQKAHDRVNELRSELFQAEGNEELSHASLAIEEGANELKNAMGALVAYAGNPNPATLAHLNAQFEKGKEKWDEGVETVWRIAKKGEAPKLE